MARSLGQCQGHRSKVYVYVHCLPCQYISLATLTYKVMHTGQHCYLNELIDFYQPVRHLHSSSQGLLHRHRSRTVLALGLCGFKHSSVAVWSSLPVDIRNCSSLSSFRSGLNTHLFCVSQSSYRSYE